MGGTVVTRFVRIGISILHCKIVSLTLYGAISYARLWGKNYGLVKVRKEKDLTMVRTSQNPSRAQPAAQYIPRPGVPI